MQFNSYIFILCFLPLALVGYFGLNRIGKDRAAKGFLLVMSLWFYGYFNYSYLLIICSSIVVNYLLSRGMYSDRVKKNIPSKILLIAGLVFNIGLIFYFKYYDFFLENINAAFNGSFALRHIVLPLGISFFTFQQISFIVDSYRGETKGYSFLEYSLFVAFFPQLVAGPIVLHKELIPQFRDKNNLKVNYDNLTRGIMLFTYGLAKKVLIADTFGGVITWGFNTALTNPSGDAALTVKEIIVMMLSYTFQIYFDFSGYSDMATGLGAMFNFRIPMNFNSPYKALSVADFWKRWHMTLTRFLTNYVYIPLGGNRKGKARTYINSMIVFLISGIWHGANWTFILWGVIHGMGQSINKMGRGAYGKIVGKISGKDSAVARFFMALIKALQWAVTFAFLNVTWLLFRSDSVSQWLYFLKRMTVPYYEFRTDIRESFRIPKLYALCNMAGLGVTDDAVLYFSAFVYMAFAFLICLLCKNNYERNYKRNGLSLLTTLVLLTLCIVSLSSVSVFLYFNF